MDADRQRRVRAVFDEVIGLPAGADRQARLATLTAGDE